MSDLSSIIEIEQLKSEIERLKAIYDHDSAAICEKHAEIKRMKDLLKDGFWMGTYNTLHAAMEALVWRESLKERLKTK